MTALLTFFETFWQPLLITSIGALFYSSFVVWYGKISWGQAITLFCTGIIVITCIFLPFNWSLHNVGNTRDLSLFFFDVNIGGNNFISDFQDWLERINVSEKFIGNALIFFLAFLEETAKIALLILCIRKSLRFPVTLVYLVVIGTHLYRGFEDGITAIWIGSVIAGFIGLIILSILLGTKQKTESVADYIFAIAMVALGFAFAENIKYMIDLSKTTSQEMVVQNAILRSIFGYLSHTFFSMICVALYARGRFAFLRMIDNAGHLSLTQKALGWKGYTNLTTFQGFWSGVMLASLIHGFYNIMIGSNILIPSIILIVGFLFLELFVLHDLRNNTKYGHLERYFTKN